MKGIILPAYQHAIDMQKHTNWTLQAMLLAEKDVIKDWKTTKEIYKNLFINHMQKSLIFGVFATKIKVVHKYAKERRVCCQENSIRLRDSHSLSFTKQIGQILAHTVC